MALEVSEKVHFIQDSLQVLDDQLGQLQVMSALAVDTLTLLSASDSLQQEEARLAPWQPIARSRHLPHSWTHPRGGAGTRSCPPKACPRSPPPRLGAVGPGGRRLSVGWGAAGWGGRARGGGRTAEVEVLRRQYWVWDSRHADGVSVMPFTSRVGSECV